MPRFLAAKPDADLIRLPWQLPLADWPTQHLVALPRGISRHVVRWQVGDDILAAKEILEEVAVQEYRLLTELKRLGVPSVEPVGVVLGRVDAEGNPLDPVLLTRHLPFSLPYRSLFYPGVKHETVNRLLDAMVVLFARLHLTGFYWETCPVEHPLPPRRGRVRRLPSMRRPVSCTTSSPTGSANTTCRSRAPTFTASSSTSRLAASSTCRSTPNGWSTPSRTATTSCGPS